MTPLTNNERARLAEVAGGIYEDMGGTNIDRYYFKDGRYCYEYNWLPGDLSDVPWWQIEMLLSAVREMGLDVSIDYSWNPRPYGVAVHITNLPFGGDTKDIVNISKKGGSVPLTVIRAILELITDRRM